VEFGMTGWTLLKHAVYLLAFVSAAYSLAAMVAAHRFSRHANRAPRRTGPTLTPPVSILKPIRGLDRETYENYASFCRQDYPEFEILFCVTDQTDPAIPVIEQLIRDFPDRSIRLLVGAEPLGASDKVNKLCRMVREARHEVIVVTDSDVRVGPGFLEAVSMPLEDRRVGGVTCLYRGLTDGSLPANLEALSNSTDFAPGVLVAWLLAGGKLDFMLGAVMATTKTHLAEIGGFESLVDYFSDDYELGNRLAARGYQVELSHFPVEIVYPRERLGEAFRHQLRWNLSIRYSRPWGHVGLIFTQILALFLGGLVLTHSWLGQLGFAAAYALLRSALAFWVGVGLMKDKLATEKLWMLWARDAFALIVWLVSFFPQRIHWRDRQFYVQKKRLVPAPPPISKASS
jgi:ceramide glucosyltransferase